MNPIDRHERFRELVSDRLSGGLDPASERRLLRHLADCPRCRIVERAYLREQGLLRALPERPAPRDLWARTSAALDREIARHPRASRTLRERDPGRHGSPALMLTALTSFVVAVAVVGSQLDRVAPAPRTAIDPGVPSPTPFVVPTQDLAFVEFTADGLAVHEATVDRACPAVAIDCAVITPARQVVFPVPGEVTAGDVDLHEADGRLALTTVDGHGNDTVSVVFLPRSDRPPVPPEDLLPPGSSAPPSAPLKQPVATPPDHGPTASLASTGPATDSPRGGSPDTSGPPGRTDEPERSPDVGSASLGVSPHPSDPKTAPSRTPGESQRPPSTGGPGAGPASATPGAVTVQAVLSDVRVVGAPPAWSSNGKALAFSAMPADRSRGPDVYVWKVGDEQATRLTHDHRSYFASWAVGRVVVSRPTRVATVTGGSRVAVTTHLLDPGTGREHDADVAGGWLPSVDPTGRFAVVWMGELQLVGRSVSPVGGALHLVDWQAIDPFVVSDRAEPEAGPTVAPTATPRDPDRRPRGDRPRQDRQVPSAGTGEPDTGPDTTHRERRSDRRPRASDRPAATPAADPGTDEQPTGEPAPSGEPADPTGEPAPTGDAPDPTGDAPKSSKQPRRSDGPPATEEAPATEGPQVDEPLRAVPLEPERVDPVREWRIDWSDDGSAVGFWVSERPDETWGKLAVHLIDTSRGRVDRGTTVLHPTLARRPFTIGRERVAWIGPAGDRVEGELRLRTWGSRGFGELRIREIDVSSGLPAF